MLPEPTSRRSQVRSPHDALSREGQAVSTPAGPISVAHFLVGRCNPESANGVDKTIYHLSRTQAGLGHRVAVFSITDKAAIPIPGVEVRKYPPVRPPFPLPNERLKDLLFNRSPLNLPHDLVTDLLAWRPNIVHLHFVHVPQSIRLGRRLLSAGIPYCVSLHGGLALEAQRRRRFAKKLYAALYERSHLNRAAFLHAISGHDVEGALAYGVDNRFVVARNCIEPGEMSDMVDPGLAPAAIPDTRRPARLPLSGAARP